MHRKAWFLLGLLVALGCSTAVSIPPINPKLAAEKAMAEYDLNKDGYLDEQELVNCPGLAAALKELDKDKDGKVSKAELQAGLEHLERMQVGLAGVECLVKLNDEPLAGARVTFVPESFLGESCKPAQGDTNEFGKTQMRVERASLPGCNLGFYRVRISKTENGQEIVPERYNAKTQLGVAVGFGKTYTYSFNLVSP